LKIFFFGIKNHRYTCKKKCKALWRCPGFGVWAAFLKQPDLFYFFIFFEFKQD
jgi:hypothetical protein